MTNTDGVTALLSFEKFCDLLDVINEQNKKEARVAKALEEILEGEFMPIMAGRIQDELLDLMAASFGDKDDFLCWWFWDNEQGARKQALSNGRGGTATCNTRRQVYRYLCNINSQSSALLGKSES